MLVAGLALIATAALWLTLTGRTGIRYSADHDSTMPMWHAWVPALAGIALARLTPPGAGTVRQGAGRARIEATVLVAAAVLFAVALYLIGGGEPAHTLLKAVLLLGVPLVLFRTTRPRAPTPSTEGGSGPHRRWSLRIAPLLPVGGWLVISYATPLARPTSDYASTVDPITLVVTVLVVFLVNALLEEVFYRRWLQSRLETVLGPWPAIVASSLLWAAWHVAIQGSGDLAVDLASVAVNQGVQGLFLGYLWSRYRVMWPLLLVHGAINAAPVLVALL